MKPVYVDHSRLLSKMVLEMVDFADSTVVKSRVIPQFAIDMHTNNLN